MTDAIDAKPKRSTREPLLDDPRMPRPGAGLVAGRYDVLEILGVGGYAIVYRARDTRLGDEIALKVLDPYKSAREHFAARFRQEVRVVRQLKHHNSIKIQDVGVTDDDCLFMAMEYVEGETLKDLVERSGGLDPGRVVRIAAQILRSLDEAHANGIIHRDLKPSNVMVTQVRGEPDYVKVLDFGIAKALSSEYSPVKTHTSEMMCTPGYAAPELLDGKEIGPQTDLYALGLMMIELLTGRDLFEDEGLWGIVHKQLMPEPIPLPPELDGLPLATVIERAIRKPMDERYPNAQSMLEDMLRLGLYPREMPSLTGQVMPWHRDELDETAPTIEEDGPDARAPRDRRLAMTLIMISVLVIASSGAVIAVRYLEATPTLTVDAGHRVGPGDGADASRAENVDATGEIVEADTGERVARAGLEACEGGEMTACLVAATELGEQPDAADYRETRVGLLTRACDGRLVAGCLALARLLDETGTEPAELEAALEHYRAVCDVGEGAACLEVGAMFASGRGGQRNDVQAVAYFRRACHYGTLDGCVRLGWMNLYGQGVQQSHELAHGFFNQACEGGNMQGCGMLGFLYQQGYGFGQNFELARYNYELACHGGDLTGCTGLAALYEQGQGVEADLATALGYYEQACEGHAGTACHRLGVIYRDGLGVDADEVRAQAFFARGCEAEHSQSCAEGGP